VKDFGAKGDGSTDDTTAINNAVTDAKATGKTVLFPAGTYFHAGTLTFNGVKVTGVGYASKLLANTASSAEENTAVILTGTSPSLTNIVVSCAGVTDADDSSPENTEGCVVVNAATGFSVSSCTLVQGQGMAGVYVNGSSAGNVTGISIDGTGTTASGGNMGDTGVWVNGSTNVEVYYNLIQNEDVGVRVTGTSSGTVVTTNSIGTVAFPTKTAGVELDSGATGTIVSVNAIQMISNGSAFSAGVYVNGASASVVGKNATWDGLNGVYVNDAGTGTTSVAQNVIRNTGSAGIHVTSAAANTVVVTSNLFGECGLLDTSAGSAVILTNGTTANLANVTVTNNTYEGHANDLKFYIDGDPGNASNHHLNAANVSGNTQTQTTLANQL
jgi:hypothetical protein